MKPAQERIYEHMRLFKARKSGDPEKNQSNSVFWGHSRDHHEGTLKTDDWKISITSAHRTPLSRQLTEGVRIQRENSENILNSKMEFGANNLATLELSYGHRVIRTGRMNKRKREEDIPDIREQPEGQPDYQTNPEPEEYPEASSPTPNAPTTEISSTKGGEHGKGGEREPGPTADTGGVARRPGQKPEGLGRTPNQASEERELTCQNEVTLEEAFTSTPGDRKKEHTNIREEMLTCHNEATLEEVFESTSGGGKGEQPNTREKLPPLPPSPTSPEPPDSKPVSPALGGGAQHQNFPPKAH